MCSSDLTERLIMEVDYFGPVALTKAVLPSMLARHSGHIVVVSSVMGYLGTPGRSTYAAAKHALHGYFDSLRAEVWRDGIKVTLVCPGYVRTAISANALGPRGERHSRTDGTHVTGIAPEDCARALVNGVARGIGGIGGGLRRLQSGLVRQYALLVLGGAVGNLLDRAFRSGSGGLLGGHVVDFIDVQWWPVWNVTDMAIVFGAIGLA